MKKSNRSKELFLEQLSKTPILQIACEKLGISRASVYRWKAEDKNFASQVDLSLAEGKLLVNDLAESQLIGAVKDRNLNAIMYWLKHHHKDYKTKIELEGSINTIQELTPEQQALVKRALELSSLTFNSYERDSDKQ
ncbi:MAG: hypothetical protein V1719_02085 [Patescibacteria group bacterium]